MRGLAAPLVIALALVIAVAVSANAADTGTISGVVFDQNGQPVADATVKISGTPLPVARTVQTGPNGLYQFQYLTPGDYVVETEKAGLGSAKRAVIVEVGKDTQVDVVIGLSLQEELTVTAVEPTIDVRSAEVGFNFTDDTLNSLPLERTYRGLFQLIPGVADNRSPVGPAAGGSRQDNLYLIDGANITSPAFGYLSTEVNELDIAEVNIKRAGVNAEFGRTSGTVVNAVSRSGSNRFSGVGRIDWLSKALVGDYDAGADVFRDALLMTELFRQLASEGQLSGTASFLRLGPLLPADEMGSFEQSIGTPLPDEIRSGPELFGKVTYAATLRNLVTGRYRHRPNHVENAGIGAEFAPSVASTHGQRQRNRDDRVGELPGFAKLAQRAIPVHEGEQRRRAGNDLGYLPAFNPGTYRRWGSTPIQIRRISPSAAASSATFKITGATKCAARSVTFSTSARPGTG